MAGTIRERSPGHFELRAYNVATDRQVTKTYKHPSKLPGVGVQTASLPAQAIIRDKDTWLSGSGGFDLQSTRAGG